MYQSSGEKRHLVTEEKHEVARKRVKMRDLESVLRREGKLVNLEIYYVLVL